MAAAPTTVPVDQPHHSLLGGVLSYLVPGLGQILQGRIGKGLLFFVCLHGLFFFGMYLGSWQNVYIPDVTRDMAPQTRGLALVTNVWNRLQFAGQFWIGLAAWPAILQYNNMAVPLYKDFQKAPTEDMLNTLQRDGDKHWDIGWVYTVIAGVLNVLVIYDAVAGPAFSRAASARPAASPAGPAQEAAA